MPTLNERAWELCDAMVAEADALGIAVQTMTCGTRIIDCGVKSTGRIEAGRLLAEVCLAGSATVTISASNPHNWFGVMVITDDPVSACMASQYAGWEIKGERFFAMGSGPMRAAAGRENIYDSIGRRERPEVCVGVLETNKLPPDSVCVDIAIKCGVAPSRLTLLVARTASAAGTVQIVARSVETALHKLHTLEFDLSRVERGEGFAPIPPLADDDLVAIGWTNDAILYGSQVTLTVAGDDASIEAIGPRVPSCDSVDYGRPFAEIFARYDKDFYRIDPLLFSPALIVFENSETARRHEFGRLSPELLAESFGNK